MTTSATLSTADLTARYNELIESNADKIEQNWKPIKTWKGKRDDLLSRIAILEMVDDDAGPNGEPPTEVPEASDEPTPDNAAPTAAEDDTDDQGSPKVTVYRERTIREASLEWLCHVDHHEDRTKKTGPENVVPANHPNARSVGLPYLTIIERIVEEFPDADTSVACLRWYAVKVRAEEIGYEGYELPQRRPRAKPAGKKDGGE